MNKGMVQVAPRMCDTARSQKSEGQTCQDYELNIEGPFDALPVPHEDKLTNDSQLSMSDLANDSQVILNDESVKMDFLSKCRRSGSEKNLSTPYHEYEELSRVKDVRNRGMKQRTQFIKLMDHMAGSGNRESVRSFTEL
jgi:hypothetical protein